MGRRRASTGMAIIGVVVGEYFGASRGIGYFIAQAEGVFDTTGVFAGMTITTRDSIDLEEKGSQGPLVRVEAKAMRVVHVPAVDV